LFLLATAADPPAELLSPTQFRDRMAAAVQAMTSQPVQTIDERTFHTKAVDGTDLTVSIDNAYAAYIADPPRLDAILARFVEGLRESGARGREPVEQLVVIVRPSDYLARSLPPGASTDAFLAPRPMAGDLSYFLAVDSPNSTRLAMKSDLTHWRIDEATAWQTATANIRKRVGTLGIVRLGEGDGPAGIGSESGLAPSILADPATCSKESAPDGMGRQIVLLYSRDMFLFAIPSDKSETARFWTTVKQEIRAGRSLSSTPLTCRDGRWLAVAIP
jgi:hypothetical protein